jgi:hypothetical protein
VGVPPEPETAARMGGGAARLLDAVRERVRRAIMRDHCATAAGAGAGAGGDCVDSHAAALAGAGPAQCSLADNGGMLVRAQGGAQLRRLDPDLDLDPQRIYWDPHVDKANIATWDYSALLYLSTHGRDFQGGEFAFNDADADRVVLPVAGRLVTFQSGFENLHQVRRVTEGVRFVLALFFTEVRTPAGGVPVPVPVPAEEDMTAAGWPFCDSGSGSGSEDDLCALD